MNNDTALTPQEVADILKITKNTVYELIKRGELNAYRAGKKLRIEPSDVELYKNKTKTIKVDQSTSSYQSSILSSESHEIPIGNNSLVICGQDILLDSLSRHLQTHPNGVSALRSYVGSYNGLYALYQGTVHMATAHLWDGDSDVYNIPFVRRMLPGVPAVIIHIVRRQLGFYVAKGNPKGIKGWEDLGRDDITIINREKGSGTRVLLDEHLRKLGINSADINGYHRETTSHLAVASAVARNGADIGIGNEKTSLQVKDIDFIPLQLERYELVIRKEDFNKPPFQAVIEILRSQEFKKELEGIGGYDLSKIGKIVAET